MESANKIIKEEVGINTQEHEQINNVFYKNTINLVLFLLYSNLILAFIYCCLFIFYPYITGNLSINAQTISDLPSQFDNVFFSFWPLFNLGVGIAIGYFCVRSKMGVLRHAKQSKICMAIFLFLCARMIYVVIFAGINLGTLFLIASIILWLMLLFIIYKCMSRVRNYLLLLLVV